jgi:hypothetical protein
LQKRINAVPRSLTMDDPRVKARLSRAMLLKSSEDAGHLMLVGRQALS